MKPRAAALLFLLVPPALAGCSEGRAGHEPVVFAAASLTDAFEEIGQELKRTRDVTVRFNFGASSDLARSIEDGSPAEVFASADELVMDPLLEEGLIDDARTFATNRLVIAVERGNPRAIDGLADLRSDVAVALCAPEVPCGRYARDALDRAGVDVEPRSFEPDVKAVLTRVALGEVDAGIVYASDVVVTGEVTAIPIPPGANVVATYPIALVAGAGDDARAFFDLVLSDKGGRILEQHGFGRP
jgi:molybdate transport system substrate-binding protein